MNGPFQIHPEPLAQLLEVRQLPPDSANRGVQNFLLFNAVLSPTLRLSPATGMDAAFAILYDKASRSNDVSAQMIDWHVRC